MLNLSNSLTPILIQRLIIAQVQMGNEATGKRTEILKSLRTRLEIAFARAAVDGLIVSGISFFASLIALGYGDLALNIRISFFASVTMGGLSFFSEMKRYMSHK